jgi:hypothetical protein
MERGGLGKPPFLLIGRVGHGQGAVRENEIRILDIS